MLNHTGNVVLSLCSNEKPPLVHLVHAPPSGPLPIRLTPDPLDSAVILQQSVTLHCDAVSEKSNLGTGRTTALSAPCSTKWLLERRNTGSTYTLHSGPYYNAIQTRPRMQRFLEQDTCMLTIQPQRSKVLQSVGGLDHSLLVILQGWL